ncbi:MAG TPA: hypothetical protein ENK16_01960 [Chromatiales bacterium]|nr:hypothetical protein [Chromatiales bacterium]
MHRSISEQTGDSRCRHQKSQALVRNQLTGRAGPAPGLLEDRRRRFDRRSHSVRSFLVGGLRPRRRVGRRQGDDDRIFLDWHEPRILYLALGILLMSCADALLTLNILNDGGQELNGIMDWLISSHPGWFAGTKIGLTAFSVTLLVVGVNRHFLGRIRVIRLMELFCAGYLALMLWELYLLRSAIPAMFVSG